MSKFMWYKLSSGQQFNYIYEKLRSLYVSKVHETLLRGAYSAEWTLSSGSHRRKVGQEGFQIIGCRSKAELARRWSDLVQVPPYMQKIIQSMFLDAAAGTTRFICKHRTSGALLM